MHLGAVDSNCVRCGKTQFANILTDIWHDLRCWGIQTALYNVWVRITDPVWFRG